MKESNKKDLANHLDPELCAGSGNTAGEALTGAHTGELLSSETTDISACRPSGLQGKATSEPSLLRETGQDAAESKNLSMCGNSMHENRETPTASKGDALDGPGKDDPTPDLHAAGESDDPIVPIKRANKADSSAAEFVEERGSTKRNTFHLTAYRTQNRKGVSLELEGVRRVASRDKKVRFTTLLHHITLSLLRTSYFGLNPKAATGVDDQTWQQYGENLESRLTQLHEQLHRGTYRAKPSKRIYLLKPDGRQRPIGIAALEDKIVQLATVTVLEQIYEEDFLGFSYGFRPGRSQHNALDALAVSLRSRKVNWVLDADIQGFFDNIDHEWLARFVEHRIADKRILRLIQKWLRAGVSEDGEWSKTTKGTPQGAVISPLLANIYLHYVFDLWIDHWRKHHAKGDVTVVRYADDFVIGFQYKEEAERCYRELRKRMSKFSLNLHPEKTRLIEFGRFASRNRERRGDGKPETFDFLGFTHYCGETRTGRFKVGRISIAKKMRAKLAALKVELRKRMHHSMQEIGAWLKSVIQGWYQYHAIPGNYARLREFKDRVAELWLKNTRRRSHKARNAWPWKRFQYHVRRWFPTPRILHPYPEQRLKFR